MSQFEKLYQLQEAKKKNIEDSLTVKQQDVKPVEHQDDITVNSLNSLTVKQQDVDNIGSTSGAVFNNNIKDSLTVKQQDIKPVEHQDDITVNSLDSLTVKLGNFKFLNRRHATFYLDERHHKNLEEILYVLKTQYGFTKTLKTNIDKSALIRALIDLGYELLQHNPEVLIKHGKNNL